MTTESSDTVNRVWPGRSAVNVTDVISWSMVQGNSLDRMLALGDKSVDVLITDPPYDQHTHSAQRIGTTKVEQASGASYSRNTDLGFPPLTAADLARAAIQFSRVTKRWVLVFSSLEMISAWKEALEAAELQYIRAGIWVKQDACPQFTGDRPASGAEAIVIAHPPGRKRWNGGGRHALWTCPIVIGRNGSDPRVHTTQKPLALMESLVRDFSEPGELICDPFAGSGTTGVAAVRNGRRFLGYELQQKYVDIANTRLSNAYEQKELFT
jgi:DNA modification methylase